MGNPTKQSAQVKGVHTVGSFEKKGLLAYLFFFFFFSIFFAGCCLLNSNWQDTFAFKIKQIIMTNMVLCTEHSTCYITNIIAATLLAANSSTCVKSTERAREGRYHTVQYSKYSTVQCSAVQCSAVQYRKHIGRGGMAKMQYLWKFNLQCVAASVNVSSIQCVLCIICCLDAIKSWLG